LAKTLGHRVVAKPSNEVDTMPANDENARAGNARNVALSLLISWNERAGRGAALPGRADVTSRARAHGVCQVVLDARSPDRDELNLALLESLEDDVYHVVGLCDALNAAGITPAVVMRRGSLLGQALAGLHPGLSLHASVGRAFDAAARRPEVRAARAYRRRRRAAWRQDSVA